MKRLLVSSAMGMFFAALFSVPGAYAAGFEARSATPAPALKARDLNGASKTLADYRGKVV